MPELLTNIALYPTTVKCFTVVLVVVIDLLFPLSAKYHPLSIVVLIAKNLDKKVRPKYSVSQQIISGTLAYLVVFGPFLFSLYLILALAEFDAFFEGVLLYVAASFTAQKHIYHKVRKALGNEKKLLARQWLSELVKRQTQALSNIGICKAAIESLLLRFVYQLITPLVLYFIGGAIFAMAYRIALECYWQWKRPFSNHSAFAAPVALFCKLCQLLPLSIICLLCYMFLMKRNTGAKKREYVATSKPTLAPLKWQPLLFHIIGKRLGMTLAGPIQYETDKQRLPKYGSGLQVRYSDMQAASIAISTLTFVITLVFLLIGLTSALS